jgi:hypothetical protein
MKFADANKQGNPPFVAVFLKSLFRQCKNVNRFRKCCCKPSAN